MNAPASALAAHELSRPAQSAFAQSARIGDYDGFFATSLASSSVDKIDGLITELQGMQQVLSPRLSVCSVKSGIMRK
jgi:hypothetical protein